MNNLNNVALWFSKDEEGSLVTIDKLKKDYSGKYHCPLCGSEVIPKAINSDCISAHFAHIDKSKCCGETIVHWWVKNELIKNGDEFTIYTDKVNKFICNSIEIEKVYVTKNGCYKPDITIVSECGKIIFVEINVSNKKNTNQYWDMWKELNNMVVEFNVRDVINEGNVVKINNNFKAIYYEGKVFIDKDDLDYKKYKSSITSNLGEEFIGSLNNVDWFIDDIYKYNKGIIDINELEAGYDEAVHLGEKVVEKMYKNNRCSNALKEIISYRDNMLVDIKNEISNEFKIETWCSNNSKKRLIVDRLFYPNYININPRQMIEKMITDKDMFSKIEYLYEIGMESIYNNSEIVICGFDNIYPYCKTKERILRFKDEFEDKLEIFDNIYDTVCKGGYLYWNNKNILRLQRNIFVFVTGKLLDFGVIRVCDDKWKYIHKTTGDIIESIIKADYSYFKPYIESICGEFFINLESDNVRKDIKMIGRKLLKLRKKYDFIAERCDAIEGILNMYGENNFSIEVSEGLDNIYVKGRSLNCSIFNDGLIRINNMNICKTDISELDYFIRDFEISINYITKQGNCLFSRKDIELYSKLLNRYTKENNKGYKVIADKMDFVIFANYNQEISRYKYDETTSFEEVIDKFSKDVRNYLYS